ncbi:MAG: HipA N-terminal domain-containing protein [Bacteroidaceae bacterium]|nr:HipA N-terminal domain-containing protein [Bacteroidaceae bacterium]
MRQGKVFVNDEFAGVISENSSGFSFVYEKGYIESEYSLPVSLTLPLQEEAFESKTLFSFFDGLIPEGWLLNVAERNWKLNKRDRMGLLLACCRDCIGNVSVFPIEQNER